MPPSACFSWQRFRTLFLKQCPFSNRSNGCDDMSSGVISFLEFKGHSELRNAIMGSRYRACSSMFSSCKGVAAIPASIMPFFKA